LLLLWEKRRTRGNLAVSAFPSVIVPGSRERLTLHSLRVRNSLENEWINGLKGIEYNY
jgi:hypothetical protein